MTQEHDSCDTQGVVIALQGDKATVKITQVGTCGECHKGCLMKSCAKEEERILIVDNSIGACVGEKVGVYPDVFHYMIAVFFVFVIPVIALFIGYALGSSVGKQMGGDGSGAGYCGMGCGLFLSFVLLYFYGKRNPVHYGIKKIE